MDTEVEVKPLNPWLSIWIQPRETIRWIVDTDPKRQVILLAVVGGIAGSLYPSVIGSQTEFIFSLIGGSISGLLYLYIGGALLRWIGSWFGGQATTEEVRAAIAWSLVPTIWSLLLWIPGLIILVFVPSLYLLFALGFVYAQIIIGIWAFVVLLKCLGEVHRFSAWKALGTVMIPGMVLMVIFFACMFGTELTS